MFFLQSCFRFAAVPALENFIYCKKYTIQFCVVRKMATTDSKWEQQKMKYMNMSIEEKRKYYKCSNSYKTVADIQTWEEYFRSKSAMPQKIDILGGFEIDSLKNEILAKKISPFRGDITTLEVDAIVNAANSSLLGGGGVDGAIHRSAGEELKQECKTLNGCAAGDAKITGGYKLPAKYVIHTVGPQREKPDILTLCYKKSFDIMHSKKLRTIAFPCIATGIYGYPLDKACQIACRQARTFLEKNHNDVDRIVFCLFGVDDVDIYDRTLQSYFPIS